MTRRRAARSERGKVTLPFATPPFATGTLLLSILGLMALAACDGGPKPVDSDPDPAAAEDSSAVEDAALPNLALELGLDLTRGLSRSARVDTYASLRRDLETPRHPSDGGGRAWLESVVDERGEPATLQAGGRGRFHLAYEAGQQGIAEGGALYFQVSSFWDWDPPQNLAPDQRGYTEVSTRAEGVTLEVSWLGDELLAIQIGGRALAPGEQIRVVYGAGPALARVDRYAERNAPLWFGVDGDGDGVRKTLDDPPTVDIGPGPPAMLTMSLPSTARPGEEVRLQLSVLDLRGSTGTDFIGEARLESTDGLDLSERVRFVAGDGGRVTVIGRATQPGLHRVRATLVSDHIRGEPIAISNPMLVEADAPRLRWADLHGHSQLSDGTGTPEDYFSYARNVAALDVVTLTDHDHWGMKFIDANPQMWQLIRNETARFHEPGRFVTLLGYEWTSWLHGHRHVVYFEGEGEVYSTLDPRYQTPSQLWDALRGQPALTFAHHSAGGPVGTNWNYPPDPELEPITEIVSVHGSSEALDSPQSIYNPEPGNFVRDTLNAGYRFGFIGSGDSHDGHPGHTHLGSAAGGGLAAIFSEELTREGVLAALRARRVYATNGARIFLQVSIDDQPMGSLLAAGAEDAESTLRVRVVAETAIDRIDLIRTDRVAAIQVAAESQSSGRADEDDGEYVLERTIPSLLAGEYHYVRVLQKDGGAAWSSPIFADDE